MTHINPTPEYRKWCSCGCEADLRCMCLVECSAVHHRAHLVAPKDCTKCDGTGQQVVDHSGAVMIETCECSAGVTR